MPLPGILLVLFQKDFWQKSKYCEQEICLIASSGETLIGY